jgi:hypothetical protein
MKREDDVLLAPKIGQSHGTAVVALERKIRGETSDVHHRFILAGPGFRPKASAQ